MYSMFYDAEKFNQPLNDWNVAGVKDMTSMFDYAYGFNQVLNNWDVSRVKNMESMFHEADKFNQPLNDWNVSGVKSMFLMFYSSAEFNQPLNDWDVLGVKDMGNMFDEADKFNQPLNDWDVSGVKDMGNMFYSSAKFNQPLNDWDVSRVDYMAGMFYRASKFNQSLDVWNVSRVTDMEAMFYFADKFNQCLSSWAHKTSPGVITTNMFFGTQCPNGNDTPDQRTGSWCQGVNENCVVCTNDPKFKLIKGNCESYLKKKKDKRCNLLKKKPPTLVADFCPAICKKELCTCEDREGNIQVKVKGKKKKLTCNEIAEEGLCKKKEKNFVLKNICPISCGTPCFNICH